MVLGDLLTKLEKLNRKEHFFNDYNVAICLGNAKPLKDCSYDELQCLLNFYAAIKNSNPSEPHKEIPGHGMMLGDGRIRCTYYAVDTEREAYDLARDLQPKAIAIRKPQRLTTDKRYEVKCWV